MQIDAACQMKVFGRYAGIAPPSKVIPASVRHAWARAMHATMTTLRSKEILRWIRMQFRILGSAFGWS